jgi:ADP-ribosyl-[dinitrogen reductase] hydrolase
MRLAAVPVRYHGDAATAAAVAAESSLTTHPRPIAGEACAFLAWLVVRAIAAPAAASDARRFLEDAAASFRRAIDGREGPGAATIRLLLDARQPDDGLERNWNWRDPSLDITGTLRRRGDSYNGYPVLPGYFGAYSVDGLAMALHAVYHSASFGEAIERCVGFLGDADSTAAVAGQIAGAIYGYGAIDRRMLADLRQWDDGEVALRGALLYDLGELPP